MWRKTYFGVFVQYPNDEGRVEPLDAFIERAHAIGSAGGGGDRLVGLRPGAIAGIDGG